MQPFSQVPSFSFRTQGRSGRETPLQSTQRGAFGASRNLSSDESAAWHEGAEAVRRWWGSDPFANYLRSEIGPIINNLPENTCSQLFSGLPPSVILLLLGYRQSDNTMREDRRIVDSAQLFGKVTYFDKNNENVDFLSSLPAIIGARYQYTANQNVPDFLLSHPLLQTKFIAGNISRLAAVFFACLFAQGRQQLTENDKTQLLVATLKQIPSSGATVLPTAAANISAEERLILRLQCLMRNTLLYHVYPDFSDIDLRLQTDLLRLNQSFEPLFNRIRASANQLTNAANTQENQLRRIALDREFQNLVQQLNERKELLESARNASVLKSETAAVRDFDSESNWELFNVRGDGSCFYKAVCVSLMYHITGQGHDRGGYIFTTRDYCQNAVALKIDPPLVSLSIPGTQNISPDPVVCSIKPALAFEDVETSLINILTAWFKFYVFVTVATDIDPSDIGFKRGIQNVDGIIPVTDAAEYIESYWGPPGNAGYLSFLNDVKSGRRIPSLFVIIQRLLYLFKQQLTITGASDFIGINKVVRELESILYVPFNSPYIAARQLKNWPPKNKNFILWRPEREQWDVTDTNQIIQSSDVLNQQRKVSFSNIARPDDSVRSQQQWKQYLSSLANLCSWGGSGEALAINFLLCSEATNKPTVALVQEEQKRQLAVERTYGDDSSQAKESLINSPIFTSTETISTDLLQSCGFTCAAPLIYTSWQQLLGGARNNEFQFLEQTFPDVSGRLDRTAVYIACLDQTIKNPENQVTVFNSGSHYMALLNKPLGPDALLPESVAFVVDDRQYVIDNINEWLDLTDSNPALIDNDSSNPQ